MVHDVRRGQSGVPTEPNLRRGCKPANGKFTFPTHDDKSRFAEVVFGRDGLHHASSRNSGTGITAAGVAREKSVGKSIDLIEG